MPPCSWTHSSAAWTATPEQYACATATASGASGLPVASASAALRAAARAETVSSQSCAMRCLSAWKEPTGRLNWWRSRVYRTVSVRHHSAIPSCSEASSPAPASRPRRTAVVLASASASRVPVAPARVRVARGRVRSSGTRGSTATPGAVASTAYSPSEVGTSRTSAAAASATPRTVPSSGVRAARAPAGGVAKGTASTAVRAPEASSDRSAGAGPSSRASASSVSVATTELVRYGAGATLRPSSSRTTAASRWDAPWPPSFSGTRRPAAPMPAASASQSRGSYGVSDSVAAITAGASARSARRARTAERRSSSSWV